MTKKQKNIILVSLTIVVIIVTVIIARYKNIKVAFDKNATQTASITLPEVETMQFNSDFTVQAMAAVVYNQSTEEAMLYFTSPITNNCNVKCEVYSSYDVVSNNPVASIVNVLGKHDSDFVLIGESDLITPGQTLQYIKLDRVPDRQTQIRIKYIAYQPNSLVSSGSFVQNTTLFIVDGDGNMVDSNGDMRKLEVAD